MPKGRPPRSLFSSLPYDLKKSLRSQTLEPYPSTSALDTVQVKAELIANTDPFAPFLPTQPRSPSKSSGEVIEVDQTEDIPEASSSMAVALKRPATIASPTHCRSTKKRKGRSRVPENDFIDHPWDCTGLVQRYTDYSELPRGLAKCPLPCPSS